MPQPTGSIDDATASQRPLDRHHVQSGLGGATAQPHGPEEYDESVVVTPSDRYRFVPYSSGHNLKSANPAGEITKDLQGSPSSWLKNWDSPLCRKHKEHQSTAKNFLFCRKNPMIVWSPTYKLAYMKTPKVASTAFAYFFDNHFNDTEPIHAEDLPEDAFVFTFVRKPFDHKLAGFAEVDLKQIAHNETHGLDNSTTFQHINAGGDRGYSRFVAFLDDVRLGRFQLGDARKPEHAASQLSGILCGHSVDFIGHLERLTTDWDWIQELAHLPVEMRTKALPLVHADSSSLHERYRFDESIPLDKPLKAKVCRMYQSEFACLGYDVPACCKAIVEG